MNKQNKLIKKKILVTGGAGFIGSHLCEALIKLGNNVASLDNYLTGSFDNHIADVEYKTGDVLNINEIFSDRKFDFIFHFGEYSRVEQSLKQPIKALENTAQTSTAIIKFWMQSQAKLIYSGSSTKFSDHGKGESLSPYTIAKSLNTQLINHFARWYKLNVSIVYFYNVYGGREIKSGEYSTVIAKYKRLVEQGHKQLPVYGSGEQKRNFTHIDDTITGILIAAERGNGDEYGIGSEKDYSILDIVKKFECSPLHLLETAANRKSGVLKTQKIKNLGWQEKHDLLEHIDEFLLQKKSKYSQ